MAVRQLHCILRPTPGGGWFVQNDANHAPHGIDTFITQTASYLRIFTSGYTFTKAGTIQISTDDDFADVITAHANVGLSNATIFIRANGALIDPVQIYSFLPGVTPGNGNLWINMTMVE